MGVFVADWYELYDVATVIKFLTRKDFAWSANVHEGKILLVNVHEINPLHSKR